MASVSTQYKYLERNPKSNYKQLFVKGTRIFARTLYGQYMSDEEPRTLEEIGHSSLIPTGHKCGCLMVLRFWHDVD